MEIKVFNNNVEKALKVAKKKLAGEGLFRELKRRRFYEKPSVRKKAKQREAQRRRLKWLAKHRMERPGLPTRSVPARPTYQNSPFDPPMRDSPNHVALRILGQEGGQWQEPVLGVGARES